LRKYLDEEKKVSGFLFFGVAQGGGLLIELGVRIACPVLVSRGAGALPRNPLQSLRGHAARERDAGLMRPASGGRRRNGTAVVISGSSSIQRRRRLLAIARSPRPGPEPSETLTVVRNVHSANVPSSTHIARAAMIPPWAATVWLPRRKRELLMQAVEQTRSRQVPSVERGKARELPAPDDWMSR